MTIITVGGYLLLFFYSKKGGISSMTIEVTSLAKMIVIMISISLMLSNWQPPIPKGQQSLICMCIGK